MQTISIDEVVIAEDRIRRDFDPVAMMELQDSIRKRGLLHAPVLREKTLIAGERRYRAIKALYEQGSTFTYNGEVVRFGELPYTNLSDLAPSELLAIELEENIIRHDISWQERVAAEKKLHDLLVAENPNHTFAETAAIIVGAEPTPQQTHNTHVDIQVAAHLDDPDIRAAKSVKEAKKIARRKLEQLFTTELAARTVIDESKHQLIHGDAIVELAKLPPNSVDCVLTDPPYGINAHTFTKQSGAVDGIMHQYDDSFEAAEKIVRAIATASCIKPDAFVWMFMDIRRFPVWTDIFVEAGWYVWPHPIIWNKKGVGALLGNANGPRHVYETVLFAQRGHKNLERVFQDLIEVRAEINKDHAAQKPVELYQTFLQLSCIAGETVLDPCCGSGTIFPAANLQKLKAIGIETDEVQYANAKLRVNATE